MRAIPSAVSFGTDERAAVREAKERHAGKWRGGQQFFISRGERETLATGELKVGGVVNGKAVFACDCKHRAAVQFQTFVLNADVKGTQSCEELVCALSCNPAPALVCEQDVSDLK